MGAERFASLQVPVLLLVGGASQPWARSAADALAAVLADARVDVLDGQQHVAMDTNRELFVNRVVTFLTNDA